MKLGIVAASLTKSVAFGRVKVTQITGWNNQLTDVFIQFFEALGVAANDVPTVKSFFAPAQTAFDWSFNTGLELSQLIVAFSTAEDKYTAIGAGGGIDATIFFETDYPYTSSTSSTGDLTTGVANKQFWSEASGTTTPKKLRRLEVKNNSGATAYIFIQAGDASSASDNLFVPVPVLDTATKVLTFGIGGYRPFRNDAGTARNGCSIFMSAAPTVPATFDAAANYNMRAVYDTL